MASKYYFINIIVGVIVLVFTSVLIGVSYFNNHNISLTIVLGIIVLCEIIYFVYILNSLNRKIASFFNSVLNEDTSLHLSQEYKGKTIKELYKSLQRIIDLFQKMKIESEFREQRFIAMIEHSSTGFISIDDHGDFEIMNETARKMLGVEHTSNMERLKDELPELHAVLSDLIPGEKKTCRITNKEFSTTVQVSSSELHFKEAKIILVSLLDIKKVIEAQELESWQKLIRIMNHEIMNSIAPITSVSSSLITTFLKDDKPIPVDQLNEKKICDTINGLEVIETMSSGLKNFVDHYRKLSQIPQPEIKPINIEKWGENIRIMSQELFREPTSELKISIKSGAKQIAGDQGLLNQVLMNLLKNAVEAPGANQPRKIELLFAASENNKTNIIVTNNGEAIPADLLDKIFIPFFTTKQNGAGIGLYLSRQIISLHQGSLSVYSNKRGTRFVIEI